MTEIDTAALRADLAVWGVRASSPELAFALCDEVDRLRGSVQEIADRLRKDGHPEDRNGFALLHAEAVLGGQAAPYAFVEAERDEARAALDRVRALAEEAVDLAASCCQVDLDALRAGLAALATPVPADAEDGGR